MVTTHSIPRSRGILAPSLRHARTSSVLAVLSALVASTVHASIPDFDQSTVTATGTPAVWRIDPSGDGPRLDEIGVVITLVLRDDTGTPVPDYPLQDIYLWNVSTADISVCAGGSLADHDTDASGVTTFTRRISGGGWTQNGLQVYVAGVPVGAVIDLDVVSADLTGDLIVDIADVAAFSQDYTSGAYALRADLSPNGVLDLADVGILSRHLGHTCP